MALRYLGSNRDGSTAIHFDEHHITIVSEPLSEVENT
jgi:hypothetical protein